MRGLLLKEWYAITSYFRAFLFMIVLFILMPLFTTGSYFLLFYPCILAGMVSVSLISYEEKEKWNQYTATLPYSRAKLVSSKYLVTLIVTGITLVGICLGQAGQMLSRNALDWPTLAALAGTLLPLCLFPAAIMLPFIYRFGAEKGRMAYYVVLGIFCSVTAAGSTAIESEGLSFLQEKAPNITLPVIAVIAYLLSWRLSVKLYEKRAL